MEDWRVTGHQDYLKGLKLRRQPYMPANPANDHDHCELCFAKFMAGGTLDTLHEGYATEDGYRWICEHCFVDLAEVFGWTDLPPSNSSLDADVPSERRST